DAHAVASRVGAERRTRYRVFCAVDTTYLHPGDCRRSLWLLPGERLRCDVGLIRTHHFRGGGAACTGPAGRLVLAWRQSPRRRSRSAGGLSDVGLHLIAAGPRRRGLARACLAGRGPLRGGVVAAPATVRPG